MLQKQALTCGFASVLYASMNTTTATTAPTVACNLTELLGDVMSLASIAEDQVHRLTSDDCDEGICGHDVPSLLLAQARVHVAALEAILDKL